MRNISPKNRPIPDELLFRRGNFSGPMDQVICDTLRQELDTPIAFSPGFRFGGAILPGEPITMEDVLSETAITYPEVYVQEMTGSQIKAVMEDIVDNLFIPDPYYQQGGDMVRLGGMDYACAPEAPTGSRISDMRLDDGSTVEANKTYRVAGWASSTRSTASRSARSSPAICARKKTIKIKRVNRVALKGIDHNPGIGGNG